MTKLLAILAIGLGFAFSAAAADVPEPNATLTKFEGQVSVNQGKEFVRAKVQMRLKPGDRVMVQEDSEATITFDDECKMEVEENKILTIPDRSTCAGGEPVVQQLNPTGGAAIGATGTPANGFTWATVALVAAIDIYWFSLNDDDEEDEGETVSP
jgi:co-chaperonin GroES (HSP10)